MPTRPDPIKVPAASPPSDPSKSAAIIFIHGLDDDAEGLLGIAQQFQAGHKLDYMQWVLPTALENMDAMARAWYMPAELSRIPPPRPELVDDEDEDGMKFSRKYVTSLIDELVEQGVPANRIVLGGFSQGHAMTLFTGFTDPKYAGKLAGLAGICGYFPMADQVQRLREESGLPKEATGEVPLFVTRGLKDMLVPSRYFKIQMETFKELGVKDELVETHEYPNYGHAIMGEVLKDLSIWLENVVPPI